MEKNNKIYVAEHRGMVGSAIVRELQRRGYNIIITRTHKGVDLTNQKAVNDFFAADELEYVFLAAAFGWTYRTELEEGVRLTYQDFLNNPIRAER